MKYFFLIRLKQTFRILKEIGTIRSLLLAFLICLGVFKLILFTKGHEVLVAAASVASVISIHFTRKDRKLLASIFDKVALIYFLEYLIISLPGILALAINFQWVALFGLMTGLIVLSLIESNRSFLVKPSVNGTSLLLLLPFEWTSGIRKNWPGLLILYLASVFAYSYSSGLPLIIIVSAVVVCSFFTECEPYQLVDLYQSPPAKFLQIKYILHLKIFWIIYSPLLILYLFCFPEFWFVPIIVILVCSAIIVLSINMKYSSYQPNEELGMNLIFVIISVCCFLIPFLAPIPFFLLIRNHRKAIKNLQNYLYAFH